MQTWVKLGRIFVPDGHADWMVGYAAVPVLDRVDEHTGRVFFSARDRAGRSHVGWVLLHLRRWEVLAVSEKPVLAPGRPGSFDADGVMATDLLHAGDETFLYYIGWNRGVGVPFRNAIGVARSLDRGVGFDRAYTGPILDRSVHDPCFVASCCVRDEGGRFRMWYLSCVEWEALPDGELRHRYHIKEARSRDGLAWERDGTVAIDFAHEGEYAISVPRVLRDEDGWHMWYSYRAGPRADTYRIGYAWSADGNAWGRRDDEVGLDVTPGEWDGEMVCYPFVFDHDGDRYLLYNGDGYGRTGFGVARLEHG